MVERFGAFRKSGLIAVLGFFLLIGFLATSVASYYVSKVKIRDAVLTRELPLASDNLHSEIQRILLPPLNVAATMANDIFLRDWILNGEQDVDKITEYLSTIQTRQGMSSAFLVSDSTRNYYSYQGLSSRIDPASPGDRWYASCRDGEAEFEINADIDLHVSNRLTLFINSKVFDYQGRFIGITGVATQIESIETLIRRFRDRYHKTIYFVSPSGQVAFRVAEGENPLEKPDWASLLGSEELAAQLLSSPSSTVEFLRDGQQILLNARFLPELKWYLVVEESVTGNLLYLRGVLMMNLVICLLITLLVLTIVYLTIQWYQKRLIEQNRTVSDQAHELTSQNRRLERLHLEKDEFMKLVVHDLKTPLNGIIGLSRLIREEQDPEQLLQYAGKIEAVSGEMGDLVQTLLDLKAVESASVPEMETVNMDRILTSGEAAWRLLARSKMITIRFEILSGGVAIRANASWVTTILGNLVSNAIKYSPEGTQVIVRLERAGRFARVSVTDQGPGILPEEQPLLFRQFSRGSNRPTAGESSSGLGLYIVKTMVEKLNGSAGVKSTPGSGSCFWVDFRLDGAE